ncbi:MAG: hypothetical protein HEP71_13485 [Roseivirga sp.]|nr:hypothetical protein [Roseivirga sp.]
MPLLPDRFYSPFYIFIKGASSLSDHEILARLGLKNFSQIQNKSIKPLGSPGKCHLYIAEDNHWKQLMDDWQYSLWFDPEIRDRLKVLSKQFDIFSCSVGDIDSSYDFRYYQKGEVIREYVMEDPKMNGGEVVTNLGTPLAGEKAIKKDPLEKVLHIASLLGIDVQHSSSKIRCYQRPELASEQFTFNEDEY